MMDETYIYARQQLIALVRKVEQAEKENFKDGWLANHGTDEINMWAQVVLALRPMP